MTDRQVSNGDWKAGDIVLRWWTTLVEEWPPFLFQHILAWEILYNYHLHGAILPLEREQVHLKKLLNLPFYPFLLIDLFPAFTIGMSTDIVRID